MNSFLVVGGDIELRKKTALMEIKKIVEEPDWNEQNNPDLDILESSNSLGIEAIRELQNKAFLKPYSHKKKAILILEAQNLTLEAQNAFLKTLEEPPDKTIIALTSSDSAWLLPTIVSRCQIIQLPPKPQISLTQKELKEFLEIFEKFTSSKIGERWEALEKLGIYQDRIKAIEWIDKMIFLVRKLLIDNFLEKSAITYSSAYLLVFLKSLNQAKAYIQGNTNIRLTLENLLLHLGGEADTTPRDSSRK